MTRALLTLVMVSGFQLRYDPAVLRSHTVKHLPRLTSQENGTDIPVEVAPARDQIVFAENGRTGPDSIIFIPLHDPSVPDYAKAYPEVTRAADALRTALSQPPARIAAQLEHADLSCIDDGHAFHSHIKVQHFPWGDGISSLTQYSQEGPQPPTNKRLVFLFLGLTRGGTHYIRAEFAVSTHRSRGGCLSRLADSARRWKRWKRYWGRSLRQSERRVALWRLILRGENSGRM